MNFKQVVEEEKKCRFCGQKLSKEDLNNPFLFPYSCGSNGKYAPCYVLHLMFGTEDKYKTLKQQLSQK